MKWRKLIRKWKYEYITHNIIRFSFMTVFTALTLTLQYPTWPCCGWWPWVPLVELTHLKWKWRFPAVLAAAPPRVGSTSKPGNPEANQGILRQTRESWDNLGIDETNQGILRHTRESKDKPGNPATIHGILRQTTQSWGKPMIVEAN